MIPNNRNAVIMMLTSTITRLEREVARLQRYKDADAGGDAEVIAALQAALGSDATTTGELLAILAGDVGSLKGKIGDTSSAETFAAQLTALQTQLSRAATDSSSSSTTIYAVLTDLETSLTTLKGDVDPSLADNHIQTIITKLETEAGLFKTYLGTSIAATDVTALVADLNSQLATLKGDVDSTLSDAHLSTIISDVETKIATLESKIGTSPANDELREVITDLETQISAFHTALGSSSTLANATVISLIAELNTDLGTIKTDLGDSSVADPTAASMITYLEGRITALATTVGSSSTDLTSIMSDLSTQVASLKSKLGSEITHTDLTNIVSDIDTLMADIYAKIGISASGKTTSDVITDVQTLITNINALTEETDTDATTAIASATTALGQLQTKLEASDDTFPSVESALDTEIARLQATIPDASTTLPDLVDALQTALSTYDPQLLTTLGNLQEEINEILLNNCLQYQLDVTVPTAGSPVNIAFPTDMVFDDTVNTSADPQINRHILKADVTHPNETPGEDPVTTTLTLTDDTTGNFFAGLWTAVLDIADTYYTGSGNGKCIIDCSSLTLGQSAVGAFKGADTVKKIENLVISKNTTNVSNLCNGCTALEEISFAKYDSTASKWIVSDMSGITTSTNMLAGCTALTTIKIPNDVTATIVDGTSITLQFTATSSYVYSESFVSATQTTSGNLTTITITH